MRTFILFIIGMTFGAAGGFLVAAGNGITFDGHDHADPAHHGAGMDHAMMHDTLIEVDPANVPEVEITVMKDPMSGYNLHVMTDRFSFTPDAASKAHVIGEGHAHVYANGVKLARLYGSWMHLDKLPKGEVEITVSLNSNDHHPYANNGAPIEAKQMITVD